MSKRTNRKESARQQTTHGAEVARAVSIVTDAGGFVVWPPVTPAGDECTCGQGGALGDHHAQTCPFYTPF